MSQTETVSMMEKYFPQEACYFRGVSWENLPLECKELVPSDVGSLFGLYDCNGRLILLSDDPKNGPMSAEKQGRQLFPLH